MTRSLDAALTKALGDQRRELHFNTLMLVLGEMIAVLGIGPVRQLLQTVADDLAEFDNGK